MVAREDDVLMLAREDAPPVVPPLPASTPPAAADEDVVVSVTGARFLYGARVVFDGLDLTLRAGEVYGLLGPNGAGKTTLVRAICGRIRLAAGRVTLAGRDVASDSSVRRKVGLVPQEIGLYGHLTARENLEVFGRLAGLPRKAIPGAVREALHQTGLVERADERVTNLSGGYRRRANIAAAILHHPALLALDEPTVGVDIEARRGVHDVVRRLSAAGIAVLLTTHDLEQAESLCDRVGFLMNGRIAPEGRPDDLVAREFHGRREIIAVLRHDPDDAQRRVLGFYGLVPGKTDHVWTGEQSDDVAGFAEIGAAFEHAGLALKELRLREPDLDSLFLKLTRQERAP